MSSVLEDICTKLEPVSSSVMLMRYRRMRPFCSLKGGGSQEREMLSEVSDDPDTPRGSAVGAIYRYNDVMITSCI